MPAFAPLLIVAANLLPLAGVVWWGWRLDGLVLLYWAEAVLAGVFALLRVLACARSFGWAAVIGPFFVTHYGTFCLCGLALAVAFFVAPDDRPGGAFFELAWPVLREGGFLLGVAALSLPLALQFRRWWRTERSGANTVDEMSRPYPKVFGTMAIVMACGMVAYHYPDKVLPAVLLVAIKTAGDLLAHRQASRRRA